MEEEMVVEQEVIDNDSPEKEPSGKRFSAGLKERWRKFLVTTKRKPQRLAFWPLVIAFIVWMFGETYMAQATIYDNVSGMGLCIFVNTLFSILTMLLFMYTFPKRAKHPNYIFMALTFAFMAIMIVCDLVWYINSYPVHLAAYNSAKGSALSSIAAGMNAFTFVIVHLVLVALSALLLATLPLYKKAILKIDTSKKLEENTLSEEIDTSAEV